MSDQQNTQGTPGVDEEADTASGGAPEEPDHTGSDDNGSDHTTDDDGTPVENPSGG